MKYATSNSRSNSAHNATAFTADTGADRNKQRHKQYMSGGNDDTKNSVKEVGMTACSEDSIDVLFEKSKPKPSSPVCFTQGNEIISIIPSALASYLVKLCPKTLANLPKGYYQY